MSISSHNKQEALKSHYWQTPKILSEFVRMKQIVPTDVYVYSALLDFANFDNIFPKHDTLAKNLGLPRTTVSSSLERLRSAGLISWIGKFGRSCCYTIKNAQNALAELPISQNQASDPSEAASVPSELLISELPIPNSITTTKGEKALNFNSNLTKEENGGEEDHEDQDRNEVLLKNHPQSPFLNNAEALDAEALSFPLKLVTNPKAHHSRQLTLRNCEVGDDGVIRLELITKSIPTVEKESLHGAQGGSVSFSKQQQLGARPVKEKTKLSSRSKKKDNKFDSVYQRFHLVCLKHGFEVPAKHYSNRQIDKMIETYGTDRFAEIAECAVENWPKITTIIKGFQSRPVPTLGEISLPFVCEHLHAHLIAKEKGLLVPEKKRTPRVKKSAVKDEVGTQMNEELLNLLANKEEKVV